MSTTHVIFDCDGGSDDAWALLLLLKASEKLKTQGHNLVLLGITIPGCGNTDQYNSARNILRVLRACNREEVPIYFGAPSSLFPERFPSGEISYFLGADGFGDILPVDIEDAEIDKIVQRKHAVHAINEWCSEHAGQVTIIAVGPLTNIALCYSMYGEAFAKNVQHIVIMGGNYMGKGILRKSSEFNFYCDPEAAEIVLAKSKCPITILPWETCLYDRFPVDIDWRLDEFADASELHPVMVMLNKVDHSIYFKKHLKKWNPFDLVAVMVFLFGDAFVRKTSSWHGSVEISGIHTRGQLVLYQLNKPFISAELKIIENVDVEVFKNVVSWLAGKEELSVKFDM